MTAAHLRYIVKATRWQLIAAGGLLGAATITLSHLTDAGPFSTAHLGVVLGTAGIGVGAAFLLDDAAATTLAAVPATLRRRSLLRVACGAVVAAAALSALLAVAWTRLDYAQVAVGAVVVTVVAVGGAAAAGRALGWARPGAVAGGLVAALVVADGLPVSVYEGVLLTGGASGADGTADVVPISLTAAALAALAWGTRDPARGPPSRAHRPTDSTAGRNMVPYDRLEQASPQTFVLTGALMGIAMVMFGLLLLELPTFPLFMGAIALAGLAGAAGLLGLQRRLRARAPGRSREDGVHG